MAKFRKKPVVSEAVQWFPGMDIEGVIEPAEVPPTAEPTMRPDYCALQFELTERQAYHVSVHLVFGENSKQFVRESEPDASLLAELQESMNMLRELDEAARRAVEEEEGKHHE